MLQIKNINNKKTIYFQEEFIDNGNTSYIFREDIESLGYEYIEDMGMTENNGEMFNMISHKEAFPDTIQLRIWYTNHNFWRGLRVEIKSYINTCNFYLKNKSELKKVMEFLNII